MENTVAELLSREYEAHQARYLQLTTSSSSLQHYAIVLSAATWAWALTNGNEFTIPILIWLPTLLTTLFCIKAAFLHTVASAIYTRLGIIEQRLGASGEDAWYQHRAASGTKLQHDRFERWLWFYWATILSLNLAVAILSAANLDWLLKNTPGAN